MSVCVGVSVCVCAKLGGLRREGREGFYMQCESVCDYPQTLAVGRNIHFYSHHYAVVQASMGSRWPPDQYSNSDNVRTAVLSYPRFP